MILNEYFPNKGKVHEVDEQSFEGLAALYPKVTGYRFNYVTSHSDSGSNSNEISNPLDRVLLRFLRSQSDLIITTGETTRSENLNSSKFAPMLILSNSANPLEIRATQIESSQYVYITQKLGSIYPNEKAIAIGSIQESALRFATNFCRLNGFEHVVLECGLTVAKDFATSNLLAEIDLTVTNIEDEDKAIALAYSFISRLGATLEMKQLLGTEDTWFFRFGA